MTNNFLCRLCSDKVGDNDDSVKCDLYKKWNHIRRLNLALNNTKNFEKFHCPGTVETAQWKYLSQHYLIKA